jgi:hypothetical protein
MLAFTWRFSASRMDQRKRYGNASHNGRAAPSNLAAQFLSRCLYLYRGRGTLGNSCGEMAGGTKFGKCMQQQAAPRCNCRTYPFELRCLPRLEKSGKSRVLLSNWHVCGHKIVIAGRRGPPKAPRPPTKGRAPRPAPRPKPPSQLCPVDKQQRHGRRPVELPELTMFRPLQQRMEGLWLLR